MSEQKHQLHEWFREEMDGPEISAVTLAKLARSAFGVGFIPAARPTFKTDLLSLTASEKHH
jgi:hypothetical protein